MDLTVSLNMYDLFCNIRNVSQDFPDVDGPAINILAGVCILMSRPQETNILHRFEPFL